jgi:hypothetical protein
VAETTIQEVLEGFRESKFELDSIHSSLDEIGPFQNIILQVSHRHL